MTRERERERDLNMQKAGKLQLHLGPKEDAACSPGGVGVGDYFSSPSSGGTWRIRFSISGRKGRGKRIPSKNV